MSIELWRKPRLPSSGSRGSLIPKLIDEIPVIAAAACYAEGTTNIKDAGELKKVTQKLSALSSELDEAKKKVAELEDREFEAQERNPNALALLDRDVDLPDRFPGETRDQVIEVIKEARDKAEAEGRVRRAQILESVLVANEPSGNLAQKRENLEKFFNANGNIVNGTVIEELTRCGIAYRNGEEYLLPKEIILRTY